MSRLVSSDFTIFALFFGVALIDAVRHGELPMALLYVALGVLFLFAGYRRRLSGTAGDAR